MPASFGEMVRLARERMGWSQDILAKRAGLSRVGITHLESGEREPAWETVQRLALAFGVSCDDFRDESLQVPGDEVPEARPRGRPKKDVTAGRRGKK